MYKMQKKMRK